MMKNERGIDSTFLFAGQFCVAEIHVRGSSHYLENFRFQRRLYIDYRDNKYWRKLYSKSSEVH